MDMTGGYGAIAGAALGAGGAWLGGNAADLAKRKLNAIADTPGLDIEALSAQALGNQQVLLPGASALVGQEATSRQALINQLLEQSLPGFTAQRDRGSEIAGSWLEGELDPREIAALRRDVAASNLGRGTGGSGAHENDYFRHLGLKRHENMDKGLSWLSALRGMSPTATPQSAFSFMGPSSQELINLRGQERATQMNMKAIAAKEPGKTATWANYFTQQGSALQGASYKAMGADEGLS